MTDPADAAPACLRCQTPMEPGVIANGTSTGATAQDRWAPIEDLRTGMSASFLGEVKSGHYRRVITYRCPRCGYLESYARERG